MERDITMMSDALTANKTRNGHTRKVYKAESNEVKQQMLSADILMKANALRSVGVSSHVDLNNTDDVRNRVDSYLQACANAGCFPNISGLSAQALGISRQRVYKFKQDNPTHPTTEYLNCVGDMFASVLVNAGLYGNASAPMVIFELKNQHAYRDQIDLAPVQDDKATDHYDVEEIRRRYMHDDADYTPTEID